MRVVLLILTFVICSQYSASNVRGQLSPEERCRENNSENVCTNCEYTAPCFSGTLGHPTPCDHYSPVCDMSIADGFCINLPVNVSSLCMCENMGCFKDPNNPRLFVKCDETDVPATLITECDHTTTSTAPIFNTTECECEAISSCPTCGSVASDTSECPASYIVCDPSDNSIIMSVECPFGACFNSTTCSCPGSVPCPSCGKYPDPDDNAAYCTCGADFPDTCGISCPTGDIFNANQCECMDQTVTEKSTTHLDPTTSNIITTSSTYKYESTTTTTVTSTTEVTTPDSGTTEVIIQCMDCGLADSLGPDCKKYYSCTPDNQIINTYYCPGEECFIGELCICL